MSLPTLYHLGKGGAIYQWRVYTVGAAINTEYGQVGGKLQFTSKQAKAKNVGKKNEVSPQEQAIKEAKAMHKKKLDLKYSLTPEEARQPVFLPMLAHPFEKVKKIEYPVDIQPKLNGVRCLASWEGSSIRLMSRGGKEYEVPHLKREIAMFLPKDMVIDGEIYMHGVTLQQVTRLVKKYREGQTDQLQLWVYDLFRPHQIEKPWAQRKLQLEALDKPDEARHVIKVESSTVHHERDVFIAQARMVEQGFEGGIVRLHEGTYELGHRSRALLKVKSFQDAEYQIIGFESGVGKFENCVIWICQTPDGKQFKVVPKGSLEQKRSWYEEGEENLGKMLTVKFFELSEDSIPLFPVGIGIREPGT